MHHFKHVAGPALLSSGFQTCGNVYVVHSKALCPGRVFLWYLVKFVSLNFALVGSTAGALDAITFHPLDPKAFFFLLLKIMAD